MTELAKALCAAQKTIEGAAKDKMNPAFRAKYADLASVWDACREALASNGLSVAQFGRLTDHGPALVTRLLHVSGEFIDGEIPLLNGKGDMQGLGSALTYARRYGLAAMVGVSPEDDDGKAASGKAERTMVNPENEVRLINKPAGYDDWRIDFIAAADNGLAVMTKAWQTTDEDRRNYWTATEPAAARKALRERATAIDAKAAA